MGRIIGLREIKSVSRMWINYKQLVKLFCFMNVAGGLEKRLREEVKGAVLYLYSRGWVREAGW